MWAPALPQGLRAPVRPDTVSAGSAGAEPAAADWSRWSEACEFSSLFHLDECLCLQSQRTCRGLEDETQSTEFEQKKTSDLWVFIISVKPKRKSPIGQALNVVSEQNLQLQPTRRPEEKFGFTALMHTNCSLRILHLIGPGRQHKTPGPETNYICASDINLMLPNSTLIWTEHFSASFTWQCLHF